MAHDDRFGSDIIVIDKENDADGMYDYYKERILRNGSTICMRKISDGFIKESLDMSDYLIVHTFRYAGEGDETGIRGFACIQEITTPVEYLYIDLICNYPFHGMKTRAGETLVRYGGKHILETVRELAESKGISKVKLSALDDVITYYSRFGYKFDDDRIREEKGKELVKALREAQKTKNEEETKKILNKIVTYYTKFYKETSQKELASVPLGERKEEHRINGIPMVLDISDEDNNVMSGGRKRKQKKSYSSTKRKSATRKQRKSVRRSKRKHVTRKKRTTRRNRHRRK